MDTATVAQIIDCPCGPCATDREVWRLRQEASGLYSRIYNIRKAHFVPTHIGLGTWGRQEPLGDRDTARVAELSKARTRLMGRAKRLDAKNLGRICAATASN